GQPGLPDTPDLGLACGGIAAGRPNRPKPGSPAMEEARTGLCAAGDWPAGGTTAGANATRWVPCAPRCAPIRPEAAAHPARNGLVSPLGPLGWLQPVATRAPTGARGGGFFLSFTVQPAVALEQKRQARRGQVFSARLD